MLPEVEERVRMPFEQKLAETGSIIEHHLEEFNGKCVISFSGGKDSTLVLHLVRQIDPEIEVVFNDTGVEYPETRDFVQSLENLWQLKLITVPPLKTFWQCWDEYGTRRKKSGQHKRLARCCYWLKEKPMILAIRQHGWLGMFTGNTAVENRQRMFVAKHKGTCYHNKQWNLCKIHPILWWTEEEVWAYTKDNLLPVNPLYAKGAHRVGCMPCISYLDWRKYMSLLTPKLYATMERRVTGQGVMTSILEEAKVEMGLRATEEPPAQVGSPKPRH